MHGDHPEEGVDPTNQLPEGGRTARADRVRRAAPRAREDRDLRCSAWPFTAPRVAVAAARRFGEGHKSAALVGSAAGARYASEAHGPRLTPSLCAGLVALFGVLGGGSGGRGSPGRASAL